MTTEPAATEGIGARTRLFGFVGALALLAGSNILVNLVFPGWAYPLVNSATAILLVAFARAIGLDAESIGLGHRHVRRSLAVGAVGVVLVLALFTILAVTPELRTVYNDDRAVHSGLGGILWAALVRVPFGTVPLEEVAFRGVLLTLLGGGQRWNWRAVLGSSFLFGLWHIVPSLALTENAAVRQLFGDTSQILISALAVLATMALGILQCLWRWIGRGVLSPIMVHIATNSGGILFAWALR